jgi:hypothetical protein
MDAAKQRGVEARWFTEILHDALRDGHIKDVEELHSYPRCMY